MRACPHTHTGGAAQAAIRVVWSELARARARVCVRGRARGRVRGYASVRVRSRAGVHMKVSQIRYHSPSSPFFESPSVRPPSRTVLRGANASEQVARARAGAAMRRAGIS